MLNEAVQRVINVKQAESTLNQRLMETLSRKPSADEDADVADRAAGSAALPDGPATDGASGGDGTSTSETTAGGGVRVKRKAAATAAVLKEGGLSGQVCVRSTTDKKRNEKGEINIIVNRSTGSFFPAGTSHHWNFHVNFGLGREPPHTGIS